MRKWDRKPAYLLEEQVRELEGKKATNRGSSRRNDTPVSSNQFSNQSRRVDFAPDPMRSSSDSYS